VPAALLAVTVQVPEPVPEVAASRLPLKPLPVPLVAPAHATVADVALDVAQLKATELPVVTLAAPKAAELTAGGATTAALPAALTDVPAPLIAVTVQLPVPMPDVVAVRLPLMPLPEPAAAPLQATLAEAAFTVAQLKVPVAPDVIFATLKAADEIAGTAYTVVLAEPIAVLPAALVAVTVQVPVPDPEVLAVKLPVRPPPVPAVEPLHATVLDVAFDVDQLKPTEVPAVTLADANDAAVTEGAATTLALPARTAEVPAALLAVTVHVAMPVPVVAADKLPFSAVLAPVAAPLQATLTAVALDVTQLKLPARPDVMLAELKAAKVTVGARTPVPLRLSELL
jgi:hypothetical protein